MPLRLVKNIRGSPNWYIRGSLRGVAVYETTGVADRTVAEEALARKQQEILDQSIHGKRPSQLFAKAAVSYMDQPGASEAEQRFILPIAERLGTLKCDQIDQGTIDSYLKTHGPDWGPATANRQLYTPLIAVLNHAAARRWCDPPKFRRPKQPPGKKRWATVDEVSALVDAAAPHLKPLIVFLAWTGARLSEALELDWSDVDLDQRWAVLRETKRKDEDRGVPLHPEVIAALAKVEIKQRKGAVFRTNRGEPYADRERLAGGQIKRGWQFACVRAGLAEWDGPSKLARFRWIGDPITPHSLRHSCSTWLTMAGAQEQVRDEILGHRSSDMGRRYSHIPRQPLIEAIDRLPAMTTSKIGVKWLGRGKTEAPLTC